ncbi:COP1-interactive protein 1 [Sesamum alatum]|uniref:COP1-interactive protein 1 n=1 Tax=Sesamum alatum TaxID=300844 RepID=A0AAE1Y3S9_9LAMI|nr:COP1-interactive protein 1 [Sesamum alatum]
MAKHRWEGSMKAFRIHIDPEKEEHQKWLRIGKFHATLSRKILKNGNKVKRILKLTKGLNGSKEANTQKKSELISLIEEFQQQYESLYSLYVDLRVQVKSNINYSGDDDVPSTSHSDSESYFSPDESNVRTSDASSSESLTNVLRADGEEAETSDVEDTILKDKLTSSSEVKDVTVQDEEVESTRPTLAQANELEGMVASLKAEVETLRLQKQRLEEQVEGKSNEAKQMHEQISRLEARIFELEAKSNGNESFQSGEDNEDRYSSRMSDLVAQTNNLQLEVKTFGLKNGELEERLSAETSQVKGLTEQVKSLQKEKAELEMELVKKEAEASERLVQIENLKNELKNQVLIEQGRMQEKESLKVQVKDLDHEVYQLSSTKSDLEEQLKKTNQEADQSKAEKEELQRRISELETSLSSTGNELSAQIESLKEKVRKHEKTLEMLRNDRKNLHVDLERYQKELEREKQEASLSKSQMEKKNNELTSKIADQQRTLLELGEEMDKLKAENEAAQMRIADSKSNFLLVERKMDEIAEEFRKQYEDKYRILSRRIRVAEQLQAENKEWYMRTKDAHEQENKDLKENDAGAGQGSIKDVSITANDTLVALDAVALRFEECTANFLNRISKSSCELKFAKDWVMRKNKALAHVKGDMDCLLHQLDDKEAEILIFREKVWKSENKIRELEKMIKENEEGMLGLQEEKREAIRQLCVWIDYHRSRSDYYKKMLSEVNRGRRKAA